MYDQPVTRRSSLSSIQRKSLENRSPYLLIYALREGAEGINVFLRFWSGYGRLVKHMTNGFS